MNLWYAYIPYVTVRASLCKNYLGPSYAIPDSYQIQNGTDFQLAYFKIFVYDVFVLVCVITT